ncbi:uncharacterized protein LAJ45_06472 [Morchella importuna]|uniref:uncharacterized protein n=1 Tax=Morchella importuna TaxID=1174673 RepID=UPI001E8E68B4|nr:uncharacterized protein LAJ45_06472 [Morchella importuna]KAH8149393.1 hypothetical protein LAJ45_06472 [Morchella importuna]
MRVCGIYFITPGYPDTPLPILASRLRTEVVDLTANHTLTQIFYNPYPPNSTNEAPANAKEAKYTFPLYESSAIRFFSAEIGSKFINGVIKPKQEAKAEYNAAKAAGKQAALLEQNTGEVFTTSVGNIRPGEFVSVVIKYVHELKQDIEVEGVRLVVPTIISPKYGHADFTNFGVGWDNGWNNMSTKLEKIAEGRLETKGLAIEVMATMNGSIRGVQSPSHPIAINIGSHDASGQGEFNPQMARAVLAIPTASTTGLEKDFTLIISSTDISMPRAFIAPHPDIPSKSTLLVTLVPRFELPQQRPEVVFVVDRSGSMTDKIATVRSALHLFLASLPVGVHFNIISFGSRHSSLWPKSKLYSAESFEAAKRHVDGMDANMGGTEMLAPCSQAVSSRLKGMNLEVLVLTDGDIWGAEVLFDFINKSTSTGDARFFSLGIGRSVSHLLVEGIGRAGKGYSQIVGAGDNMQKKIMRMLKSALTPHVNDWRIDWEGKEAIMSSFSQENTAEPTTHAPISLYDTSSNPDEAKPTESSLPARPPILQAPSIIPSLYSFTRTSVYFLLTECTAPKVIRLLGTAHDPNTNSIHPLALNIPVATITSSSSALGLYSLLGRKLLQDLEEDRCGYLPAHSPHKDAEGTDLGVTFGLASKWTSFVAVATDDGDDEMDIEPNL